MDDLYSRMGKELRALFVDLFDPKHAKKVHRKMEEILATARQIGGPIQLEAERLNGDVIKFLERPGDPKRLIVMKEHALRLEHETREL